MASCDMLLKRLASLAFREGDAEFTEFKVASNGLEDGHDRLRLKNWARLVIFVIALAIATVPA